MRGIKIKRKISNDNLEGKNRHALLLHGKTPNKYP